MISAELVNTNLVAQDAFKIATLRGQIPAKNSCIASIKYLAGEMIELAEAAKAFLIEEEAEEQNTEALGQTKSHLAEELADIIICAMSISAQLGIDLESAVNEKMVVNLKRALDKKQKI